MDLATKPKILFLHDPADTNRPDEALKSLLTNDVEVEEVGSPLRALVRLAREDYAGMVVIGDHLAEALRIGKLLQNEQILEGMPDGIVLLDSDNTIIWGNGRMREWSGRDSVIGMNFYAALDSPEILGPDFCPFHSALATGKESGSTLRSTDNRYFQVHAAPVREPGQSAAAPDRHGPRRDQRSAAAAEAGGDPPGGHGVGRSDARRTLPHDGRRADRAVEVEHPALHEGPAAVRRRRDSPARPRDERLEPLLAVGMDPMRPRSASSSPSRRTTA